MRKKDNTPFLLKFVRWGFPKLEKLAPRLAQRYFIHIFFTPLRYKTPEKERKAETFATEFRFDAAGKHLQGYEWGDPTWPYVLLVHGWAGRTLQFRRFIKPLLKSQIRVVGFDGPAHGRSTGKQTSIVEFKMALDEIFKLKGEPSGILAHSFGGVASLYAGVNGFPLKKLIMIASPSIGDEVIRTFLNAVNGSWKTGLVFKEHIERTTGKSFDEFSGLHLVQNLPSPIDLLIVHDENDREVNIKNAEALVDVYPNASFIRTKKVGHTRILKDNDVIRRCVTFLRGCAS